MDEMRAAQLRRFGDPSVLEVVTVLRPAPGPHEVLVRVGASAVNTHDTLVRDGTMKLMAGRKFPMGVGLDFAARSRRPAQVSWTSPSVLGSGAWSRPAGPT